MIHRSFVEPQPICRKFEKGCVMQSKIDFNFKPVFLGFVIILTIVALIKSPTPKQGRTVSQAHPQRIMGTDCTLGLVILSDAEADMTSTFLAAEQVLRQVEALMSTYIDASEISVFNYAPADSTIKISTHTRNVLTFSRTMYARTDGVFDVTCRPQIELWKQMGQLNRLPTPEEMAAACQQSNWGGISMDDGGLTKSVDTAQINLGGIAKGYGIDLAVEAMIVDGIVGGMVDVGGDMRCFGMSGRHEAWEVKIRHPFRDATWGTLRIRDKAVCTSGNYARYAVIEGRRYSHIIDPRTGWPADIAPSVTVIAKSALIADAWATALSVLGQDGMDRISNEQGVDAMIVVGTEEDYDVFMSDGFADYLMPDSSVLREQ